MLHGDVALQFRYDERGLAPSSLREVVTAGEQLRVTEAMRRWMGALGTPLYNHYGPSETHVVTRLVDIASFQAMERKYK